MDSDAAVRLVLFLLLLNFKTAVTISKQSIDAIRKKERFVSQLAAEAEALFQKRGRMHGICDCSVHVCETSFSQTACSEFFPSSGSVCERKSCLRDRPGPVTYIQTPPDQNSLSISQSVKQSICLYKQLEPTLIDLDPVPDTTTSISTMDGHRRIYPGSAHRRELEKKEDRFGNDCKQGGNPMRSAEYAGAAVGAKDVVLVIDSTASMAKPVIRGDKHSRLDAFKGSLRSWIDSFSAMDHINIVEVTDKARRRGTGIPLFAGDEHEQLLLRSTISNLYPYGDASIMEGIYLGIDLLIESNRLRQKKRVFSGGHKLLIVVSGSSGNETQLEEFFDGMEERQMTLRELTGEAARIFTVSIGIKSEEAMLRQLACRYSGVWFGVSRRNEALEAFYRVYTFLASTHLPKSPVWSNTKKGPELVTTVSKAFHFHPGNDQNPILLGVISHDVMLSDISMNGTTPEEVAEKLQKRSRRGGTIESNVCQLQIARNVYAGGRICADTLPSPNVGKRKRKDSVVCYKFDDLLYYKKSEKRRSWDEALESCEKEGGTLAHVPSAEVQAFLAAMASADGSWIGGRGDKRSKKLQWLVRDGPGINLADVTVSRGQMSNGVCLAIDGRGVDGNIKVIDCWMPTSSICVFDSKNGCDHVISVPKRGYFETPPLDFCVQEEETLADLRLTSSVSFLDASQFWCSLDGGQKDRQSLCCKSCDTRSTKKAKKSRPKTSASHS